jgi:N-ethylmaleimide reductase
MNQLFETYQLGEISLANRVVMAPMTRSRAANNLPNALMAEYYGQRATAGLIVTEGISPSPNGLGYARIPGLYSTEQVAGWRLATEAVHSRGGKIFAQIMHTGRVAHTGNLPTGGIVLAPSAIAAAGTKLWVAGEGELPVPTPKAMTAEDIATTIQEYADAATNAVAAGFDGIELHGANGYLLKQFMNANTNTRTDRYGGNIANRLRFVLEVVDSCIAAIGKNRVGIRISPYNVYNDMQHYPEIDEQYAVLATELQARDIAYLHIMDASAYFPQVTPLVNDIRTKFRNTLILNSGFTKESGETAIKADRTDLIAYGRPFIGNPDLVARMKGDLPLAQPKYDLLYSPGAEGYTDYPTYQA